MTIYQNGIPKFQRPGDVVDYINNKAKPKQDERSEETKLLEDTGKVLASLVSVDQRGRPTPQYLAARGAAENVQLNEEHSTGRTRVHVILRHLAELGVIQRHPPKSTSNGAYRLTDGGRQWLEVLVNSGLIKLNK